METDDVRVVLNLFGLSSGMHRVEPEVITPDGITVRSVSPPILQVEIASLPSPESVGE
jgi:hypothetical protein